MKRIVSPLVAVALLFGCTAPRCDSKPAGVPAPTEGAMLIFAWTYYAFTNRLDDATTIANWREI